MVRCMKVIIKTGNKDTENINIHIKAVLFIKVGIYDNSSDERLKILKNGDVYEYTYNKNGKVVSKSRIDNIKDNLVNWRKI